MRNETWTMETRKYLLSKCAGILDDISRRLKNHPSREQIVDKVLRSYSKSSASKETDIPLYMVCKWLNTHDYNKFPNNKELRKAIIRDTQLSPSTVISIFISQEFDLPEKLGYVKRKKVEVKVVEVPVEKIRIHEVIKLKSLKEVNSLLADMGSLCSIYPIDFVKSIKLRLEELFKEELVEIGKRLTGDFFMVDGEEK